MSNFLVVVISMIGVAFLIVVERKGLGMFQLRQGPNKVGFKGLVQPVADGVKLFTKEMSVPFSGLLSLYLLGPMICFFLSYVVWVVMPTQFWLVRYPLSILFLLCVSSTHVFGTFLVGWTVDSRYAMLGAMRGVAQTISYEVVFSGVVLCPLLFVGTFDFLDVRASSMLMLFFCCEAFLVWIIVLLAELNRAPFDFVEGESELVAGYMVEYGGVGFALIALAEYGNIFFMSMITGAVFLGGVFGVFGILFLSIWTILISYVIVGVRGSMPRFRYDLLMCFCWQKLLPLVLGALMFYVCFLYMIF
nr:NADH dehydrogenase subunit 1 [Mytilopsis leucophaeata]